MSTDEKKINNTKQLELNIDYLSNGKPYTTVELFDGSGNLRVRRALTKEEKAELQELLSSTIKDNNEKELSIKEYLKTKRTDNR